MTFEEFQLYALIASVFVFLRRWQYVASWPDEDD